MIFTLLFVNPRSGNRAGFGLLHHVQHAPFCEDRRCIWLPQSTDPFSQLPSPLGLTTSQSEAILLLLFDLANDRDRNLGAHITRFLQEHGSCLRPFVQNRPLIKACLRQHQCPVHAPANMQLLAELSNMYPDLQTLNGISVNQTESVRIHIISAGGDGTFTWVLDTLRENFVDPFIGTGLTANHLTSTPMLPLEFSVLPLGTGNDLSQVMGYGRTAHFTFGHHFTHRDPYDQYLLQNLEALVLERINGHVGYLDVWDVVTRVHIGGFMRKISRGNEHHVIGNGVASRRMVSTFSIGLMGYVGLEMEARRAKTRLGNWINYTKASLKWVLLRRFPAITQHIRRILSPFGDQDGVLEITFNEPAVELIVQNIPGIWGRNIDIWGENSGDSKCFFSQKIAPQSQLNWNGRHPQTHTPQCASPALASIPMQRSQPLPYPQCIPPISPEK